MSVLSTITLQPRVASSSSVHLSPIKRHTVSSPEISVQEIYNWTFHSNAVAACTVKDVHSIRASTDSKYNDFYWIGSVPCRTVKVVGLIIGIQVYEKRILYLANFSSLKCRTQIWTVDDGTGVIDCYHAQHKEKTTHQQVKIESNPPLVPVADVGTCAEIIGTVREVHDSRQISISNINICSSPNDELRHARTVRMLHQTKYSGRESFKIPRSVSTPPKPIVPITPSTLHSSPPSSVSSSPIKPEHIEQNFKSPIKLRHPSRLHTHDFTENTFRIYLKHYMDHASNACDISYEDYDTHFGVVYSTEGPSTPTKGSRPDQTPRQSTISRDVDTTPRSHMPPLNYDQTKITSIAPSSQENPRKGYTLSFLRRVPELSLLASKVVHAVGRKRMREEKQRLKEAGTIPSRSEKSRILSLSAISPDKVLRKTKRLFEWAINRLHQDGSIVLWDGPVRPCPESLMMDTSRLWKTSTSSILVDDSNFFSTTAGSTLTSLANDTIGDGSLSDPDSNEEAYITLTSDYLAGFVEQAIKTLVDHYEKSGKPYAGATKDGILAVLRKDDRWRYVGTWNIEDTLDFLRREGKVWSMGKGRWDLTG